MAESLGEKLRKAREERDISISEVAEQTRISALYLEAIENDDYKPLPGGIFNKGFVKSFAKYVGVDEGEALQEYARIAAGQEVQDPERSERYRPEVLTDDRSGPSLLPTIIFSIIILGLLAWGVMLLVNYLQGNGTAAPSLPAGNAQNTNTANASPEPTALPRTDEIRLKIATGASDVSVSAAVDGNVTSVLVPANSEREFTGKERVKVSYYKGLASTIELFLNGTKLATPIPPEDWPTQGFEFEINQGNIREILRNGRIATAGGDGAAATASPAPATGGGQ
ncbi:MAG: helix-turn-helix domain-containing protein [Acidobacteriota bacterium]|nr:MAG: helix-turn-helix domain-containing protein [Acidobacteriota bacterium]